MIYILHSPATVHGAYGSSTAALRALEALTGLSFDSDHARRLRGGVVLTVDGIVCQPINLVRK